MGSDDELQDDLRRFEYGCPKCGKPLTDYAETCPYCGQNLSEEFSGTFRPKRSPAVKLLILLVLIIFLTSMLAVSIISLRALLGG